VNSSRGIIYADKTINFAEGARNAAADLQIQMSNILKTL